VTIRGSDNHVSRQHAGRPNQVAVVIGGANVDVKARSSAAVTPGTSNPGSTYSSAGGVGRNIAENLARLGTRTSLLASIGTDAFGEQLLGQTSAAGVLVDNVLRSKAPTGTYTAVLDHDGELVVAVSDMKAVEELDPAYVLSSKDLIASASFLVLDGNLRLDVVTTALDLAQSASIPVLIDPVSDVKAQALAAALLQQRPIFVITPNRSELAALTSLPTRTDAQIGAAAAVLHNAGVTNVWVSLGERGSLLFSANEPSAAVTLFDISDTAARVVDVTGAGDAMVGGLVHALLDGRSLEAGIHFAHAAAALNIESPETVRADTSSLAVDARLRRNTSIES
jgi:pseudouridine kinase